MSGTATQPAEEEGEEDEEVETTGFKLSFHFRENPYFTNTVRRRRTQTTRAAACCCMLRVLMRRP